MQLLILPKFILTESNFHESSEKLRNLLKLDPTNNSCYTVAFIQKHNFIYEVIPDDIVFLSSLALFMVDAEHVIYLWHGWWPQSDEDSESRASTTGSAQTRWSNDRRLAMETIKTYAEGTKCFHLNPKCRYLKTRREN